MAPAGAVDLSRARGFTLIELLVVITIIGLLMALLMPVLQDARSQSKRAVCASHLHQLGVAMRSYLNESNDRLPYASLMPSMGPMPLETNVPIYIADVLIDHLSGDDQVFQCPNDEPGGVRPDPNNGLSYFESERSSYEYRTRPRLAGATIQEVASRYERFTGKAVSDNEIWLMRDYDNFHGEGGTPGARRYLYVDGHVTDFEN